MGGRRRRHRVLVRSVCVGAGRRGRASLRGPVRDEELLQQLEDAADLLLRDLCQGKDLCERAWDRALPTRDEDAPGDDSGLRFRLQHLVVVHHLEQRLRRGRHVRRDLDGLAESPDLSVRRDQDTVGGCLARLLVCPLQVERFGAWLVLDIGLQLRSVEERIHSVADTAGVCAARVVVRERPPFGPRVDNALAEHQPAVRAHGVAGGVLIDDVRRVHFALRTGGPHPVVCFPLVCLQGGGGRLVHTWMSAAGVSRRSRGRKPGVGGDKNELNRIQGVEKRRKREAAVRYIASVVGTRRMDCGSLGGWANDWNGWLPFALRILPSLRIPALVAKVRVVYLC